MFDVGELRRIARARNEDRPEIQGDVDWERVEDERIAVFTAEEMPPPLEPYFTNAQKYRATAQGHYVRRNPAAALTTWRAQPREPQGPVELAVVAEAQANAGNDAALRYIDQLGALQPAEADALRGLLRWRQARLQEATDALEAAFTRYREDPWPAVLLMSRALDVAVSIAAQDQSAGRRLYDAIRTPFAVAMLDEERKQKALGIAAALDFTGLCAQALEPLEPWVPWEHDFLVSRARCYQDAGHPKAALARDELIVFLQDEPMPLANRLMPPASASP
jgi:hypothetical protein